MTLRSDTETCSRNEDIIVRPYSLPRRPVKCLPRHIGSLIEMAVQERDGPFPGDLCSVRMVHFGARVIHESMVGFIDLELHRVPMRRELLLDRLGSGDR